MDDNMNYNQINDVQTNGESQPVYQEQPYQPERQGTPTYQSESSASGSYSSMQGGEIPQGMGASNVQDAQLKSNGFAIAGMVCGIVAAVVVCCFFPISIICGIAGIVLSIVALVKKQSKGMAIAGIITSVVAILLSVVIIVVSVVASFSIMDGIKNGTYDEYYYNELYDELYDELNDSYF